MGKLYDAIDDDLAVWLKRQYMFFVATAPSGGGHVNCSPKGRDAFLILGPREVAYLDYIGSGIETVAHLRENGRIVLMFCAFDGPPKIVRLHGRGRVTAAGSAGFAELLDLFLPLNHLEQARARSIISVSLDRISDSCGYGVPLMDYRGERDHMDDWAENRLRKVGPDAMQLYQQEKNLTSIDGLPGLDAATLRPVSAVDQG